MSKRFVIFLLVVWYPLILAGGAILGAHYAAEVRAASILELVMGEYVFILIFFAPLLWHAFGRKA